MRILQDENTLVQRAAKGERDAFSQLLQQYQKPIYNLALRMVGDREDAADLTQDVFLKAWRSLPFFKEECSFSTWLYRLASNICIDFLRHQKRRRTVSLVFLDRDDEETAYDPPSGEPEPEQLLLRREQLRELARAMDALEVEYRQILTLRVIDGLDYSQIAEILECKVGTVKSRLSRARAKLRLNLQKIGNQPGQNSSIHMQGGMRDGV